MPEEGGNDGTEGEEEAPINGFQAGCKHSNNVDNDTPVQETFSANNLFSFNMTHHSGYSNIRCGFEEQSARGEATEPRGRKR